MRTVIVDCLGVMSEVELWQRYIDAADPAQADIFGRNLDAFWDAIEHSGPGSPGDARIVFLHSQQLGHLRLKNGRSFLDELARLADEASTTPIKLD